DFSALTSEHEIIAPGNSKFILEQPESGICKVVCFSPRHDLTLAEMQIEEITQVVKVWKDEYSTLGSNTLINYITIFENKGELMGCSNPHPHGQIWAQHSIPEEPALEQQQQLAYYSENHETLLSGYLAEELQLQERIVAENNSFVLLVPFWAVWPFETMILPKSPVASLSGFDESLTVDFADMIRVATAKYDNIFHSLFPYSSGIHQAPTDGKEHPEWHMHMHFYPPLLRSATVKKFMVGYELIAEPQRDITAESSAAILRGASTEHFNRR
ncbi:MAG: galactose-1-phosphate uridylyltransferase, partial [Ignavibacteriales bacterium]|nr:galactose-1-phosphate uridylyltransferase [Ignavibacteriales bacterium]